ncbi:MAG: thioredoxin family protein [Dehalococcoidales bacterium]|nr:thioredoxin family protein [Dehalococcoidales bacterium]
MNTTLLQKYLLLCTMLFLCPVTIVSCTSPASTPPPPQEEELPVQPVVIELLGSKHEALVDSQGRLKASVQFATTNGTVSLSIDKGTLLLDGDYKPLQIISIAASDSLPLPPENTEIMGTLYEISPPRSTASPLMRLTLSYDPQDLPDGINEDMVYITSYTEGKGWGSSYYKRVDTENNRVTTQVSNFGHFAVLAPVIPPPSDTPIVPAQSSRIVSLRDALSSGKPTLAEFGSSTCIPCKQMKPILEQLARDYEGKLNVVIVDVYAQKALTNQYRITGIPTQIVFDSSGKEVTRHIGVWTRAQIVTQLKKMGIE